MDIFVIIVVMLVDIIFQLNSLNKRLRILELKYEKLEVRLENCEKQMDKFCSNF
jgi:chaperonin cofactor prefoldin